MLCVAACPQEALYTASPEPLVAPGQHARVLLRCDRAAPTSAPAQRWAPGCTGCLHALDPAWLLEVAQTRHAQEILLWAADCSLCERRPPLRLDHRWQVLLQHLPNRPTPWPMLKWTNADDWRSVAQSANSGSSRRRMVSRLFKSAPAAAATPAPDPVMTSGRSRAVHDIQREGGQPLWAVSLAVAQCNWCMACIRLCPTGAIRHHTAPDGIRALVHVDSDRCTGCGLCEAACDSAAIRVRATEPPSASVAAPAPAAPFRLARHTCSACRIDYWRWADQPASRAQPGLCPTCLGGKPRMPQRIIDDRVPAASATPPVAPSGHPPDRHLN